MNKKFSLIACTLLTSIIACNQPPTYTHADLSQYLIDTFKTNDGTDVKIVFFSHASFAIECDGKVVYIDPVGEYANYESLPMADAIVITHHHGDHFDTTTVNKIRKEETEIISTATVVGELAYGKILNNGDTATLIDRWSIEAVAAYNTTAGRDGFHPNNGRDNGYIINIGGSKIYISGDSEPTPEMMQLQDIDVLFLSVNQPYTMTVEQAVEVVETLTPKIFYPIHYGRTEASTNIEQLSKMLFGKTDVRVFPME